MDGYRRIIQLEVEWLSIYISIGICQEISASALALRQQHVAAMGAIPGSGIGASARRFGVDWARHGSTALDFIERIFHAESVRLFGELERVHELIRTMLPEVRAEIDALLEAAGSDGH